MSLSVKQVGQVSAQLKSQIEQFQQNLDQNDVYISELKEHVCYQYSHFRLFNSSHLLICS
jgi:hypothetical protein